MSNEMKSANALTSIMLTESNWQLWRPEAIIGLQRLDSYNIATGDEPRLRSPTPSANLSHLASTSNVNTRPKVDRSQLSTILANAERARLELGASPDDVELQSRNYDTESELLQFMTAQANRQNTAHAARSQNSVISPSTDWQRRHSKAYHLLLMSLSEHFKTMTVDCIDLSSTWKTLVKHFECKPAADILAAEAVLERLSLHDTSYIMEFLNQVKLVRNSLSSCGAPISDSKLFLTIIKKLPPAMNGVYDTIMYGAPSLKTYEHLERSMLEFYKDNPVSKKAHSANTASNPNIRCTFCRRQGHSNTDCRQRTHTCQKCRRPGHFEKYCRSNRQRPPRNVNNSHHAFNAEWDQPSGDGQWIIDTGASTSICPFIKPTQKVFGEHISLVNGESVPVKGRGSADVGFRLSNVLHVRSASRSLLSIGQACLDGDIDRAIFDSKHCRLEKDGDIVAVGNCRTVYT